jgi:hypothetical protein
MMVKNGIRMDQEGALCVKNEETMDHLFVQSPYAREVWSEPVKLTNVNLEWRGDSLEACYESWYKDKIVVEHKELSCCGVGVVARKK